MGKTLLWSRISEKKSIIQHPNIVEMSSVVPESHHGGGSKVTNGSKMKSNNVRPSYYSGFPRMKNRIFFGFTTLTAVYFILEATFRTSKSILGLPPAAEEYCSSYNEDKNDDKTMICSRSDLFAFQMSSFMAIIMCGCIGFNCWHITKRVHTVIPKTPEGRLFGYLEEGERVAAACFTFQFFDLIVSMFIPEHCTAIMIIHHILAACVSWFSVTHQVLHYYGTFFLGVTEVSSIMLVFVDLAKYFPPLPGTYFDMANGLLFGPLFAISFFSYRVLLWWKVSYRLWSDCYYVLSKGIADKLRPGSGSYILYMYMAINIPLGLLQLY